MKKRIYPFCDYCKTYVSSFVVFPILQHDPNCRIRLEWEKKNPNQHPDFKGREWKKVVDEGTKRFYEDSSQ